jgi:hypothetical protein
MHTATPSYDDAKFAVNVWASRLQARRVLEGGRLRRIRAMFLPIVNDEGGDFFCKREYMLTIVYNQQEVQDICMLRWQSDVVESSAQLLTFHGCD